MFAQSGMDLEEMVAKGLARRDQHARMVITVRRDVAEAIREIAMNELHAMAQTTRLLLRKGLVARGLIDDETPAELEAQNPRYARIAPITSGKQVIRLDQGEFRVVRQLAELTGYAVDVVAAELVIETLVNEHGCSFRNVTLRALDKLDQLGSVD